jgi:hypothetical protein
MQIHVDISELVMSYFAQTGKLPPEILDWEQHQLEELMDAIPEGNSALRAVEILKGGGRWRGLLN